MADVSKIKLPNNQDVNIKDYRISGVDTTPTSGSGNVITSGGVQAALTNGSVTKVGTSTVGSSHRPIYLNSGKPTQVTDVGMDYIGWPVANHGTFSSLDNLYYNIGPNVLAYPNPNYIDVEYSNNGGVTWLDYGLTDTQKRALFTTSGGVSVGKKGTSGVTTDDAARITIHTGVGAYCKCEFIAFRNYFPGGCDVTIEYTTFADQTTYVEHTTLTKITGNPGYRVVPFSKFIFGNNGVHDLRITFRYNGTSYATLSHSISEIRVYGSNVYSTNSTLAKTGHVYSYDADLNVIFPAQVTARSFVKSGGTSSQFLKADGSVDSTQYATASVLENKQDTLVSGTNIKTVNNNSLLGSGNISVGTVTGSSLTANNIILGNGSSAIKSSGKTIVTTLGTTDTTVPTSKAVKDAINALPEPMIFKGTLGTGGTITTLPAAAAGNTGYTYKVITNGTYQSIAAKDGDTFISNGSSWTLIPSGDEPSGTVTNIATGTGLIGGPITTTGTISIDTDVVALKSDVPSTLDQIVDGSTRKLSDYLPLDGGNMKANAYIKLNNSAAENEIQSAYINIHNKNTDEYAEYGIRNFLYCDGNDEYTIYFPQNNGTIALTSDIPSAVTESTVSGWGFTKNTGTVTSVKVGTTSYNPSSGVVSLPAYPTVPTAMTATEANTGTATTARTITAAVLAGAINNKITCMTQNEVDATVNTIFS